MNTSNNNAIVSAEQVSQSVMGSLKGVKGVEVTMNCRSIWVKAPRTQKVEKALTEMGFRFAESKNAWWYTYNATPAPAQKAQAKKATAQKASTPRAEKAKAQKASTQKATQPKAERKFEELDEDSKAQVRAYVERAFPGVTVSFKGGWVYLGGETKSHKDGIKALGLFWGSKIEQWCGPAEKVLAAWADAPAPAPKAEPKAQKTQPKKAQKKAKKTALKGGVVSMAELFA